MAKLKLVFSGGSDEDPPTFVETHASTVGILQSLDQACRNEYPAWCLSNALDSIANRKRGKSGAPLRLEQDDRDQILRALTRAKALMPEFIPEYPPDRLALGIDAAMTQVVLWAETPDKRALRHPHTAADADDLARMLRNDMHNLDLLDRVRERHGERSAEALGEMLSPHVEWGVI